MIALIAGLGVLIYLLGRRLEGWEYEVLEESNSEPIPAHQPPVTPDTGHIQPQKSDLKKIKGIGPVIEKKLNALGIHNFKQIAYLTDLEKNSIETELRFPGRIERDQWVEQAKALLT